MRNKWKIAVPVIAGVLAISTGIGVVAAKGVAQNTDSGSTGYFGTTGIEATADDAAYYGHCGAGGGMMGFGPGFQVTPQLATLLGTTPADLEARLQAGETLADIASAKGVSQDQLIQTLLAPHNEMMAIMAKYGYVTQEQVNTITQQLRERLQTMITTKLNNGGWGGWGHMGGYGDGMMGGWDNTPQQPGTTTAPRTGPGGMMGRYGGMMGRW